jgi:hypothetical protein
MATITKTIMLFDEGSFFIMGSRSLTDDEIQWSIPHNGTFLIR